jgi:hypothetical protein
VVVSSEATLAGATLTSFDATQQAAFAACVANISGTDAAAVSIVSITTVSARRRSRGLLQSTQQAVRVAFEVAVEAGADVGALRSALSSVDPAALVAQLASRGITSVTGVVLAPPTLATAPTPSPPPPSSPPLPPGVAAPSVSAITLSSGASPAAVDAAAAAAAVVNPGLALVLFANVSSTQPITLTLAWAQAFGPTLNLSDPGVASTPLDTPALGLHAGVLQPGSVYRFELTALDAGGSSSAQVSFTTMMLPTGGVLAASASSGVALSTTFTLYTAKWTDGSNGGGGNSSSLAYLFQYTVVGDTGVQSDPVLLADFDSATAVSGVRLPAGNISVQTLARTSMGATCAVPAVAFISVSAPVFADAAAQASALSALITAPDVANMSRTAQTALVSAAVAALNDPAGALSSDDAAAASVREELLTFLLRSSQNATQTATPESLVTSAATVANLLSNPAQINAASSQAALSLLLAISSAGMGSAQHAAVSVTPAAAAAVGAGLSSLLESSGIVENNVVAASSSTTLLPAVTAVVGNLSASLTTLLTAPGGPAIIVFSPAVQLMLSLDTAGPGSRLFSAPFQVEGGASSFAPLPTGALASLPAGELVRSEFLALSYDPYQKNGSAVMTAGVTRLALSSADGAPLELTNLRTLITAKLSSTPGLDGLVAQAVFWDSTALNYSSAGMVAIPNPAPPGVLLDWVANFSASSDAILPLAWNIVGGVDDCTDASLNCGDPSQRGTTVAVCSAVAEPAAGAYSCGTLTSGVIRMWTGCNCTLWQEQAPWNASAPWCHWNVSSQSFTGAGCMFDNVTRIGTRHLTDFAVQTAPPKIRTLSAADLVAISPQDLVHIKDLLVVICVLFAAMHVGAFILNKLDRHDFNRLKQLAQSAAVGCNVVDVCGDTLCTWRLTQDAIVGTHSVISGPAVAFASLDGVPYARLAFAVPETMLGQQPVQCAVGRPATEDSPSTCADDAHGADGACGQSAPEPDLLTMASTAFMHALQQSWCIASGEEIVAQQRLFFAWMAQEKSPLDPRQFLHLFTVFKEMLIGGNLRSPQNWMQKARMWRIILLSNDAGSWEPSDALAFALLANNRAEPATALHGVQAITAALSDIGSLLIGSFVSGSSAAESDVGAAGAASLLKLRHALPRRRARNKNMGEADAQLADTKKNGTAATLDLDDDDDDTFIVDDGEVEDDERVFDGSEGALCFSSAAICETVPDLLRGAMPDEAAVGCVWATALVSAHVASNRLFSWRVSSGSTPLAQQRTLQDAADDWLHARLCETPDVYAAVTSAARRRVALWAKYHDRRITRARKECISSSEHAARELHRAVATVHHALVTQHPSVSLITTEFALGFVRWMGFIVLVSVLMAMLVVNIWFCAHPPCTSCCHVCAVCAIMCRLCRLFQLRTNVKPARCRPTLLVHVRPDYSKAVTCCADLRALLGCDAVDVTAPCNGFVGSCGDLALQPDAVTLSDAGYTCTAFPADGSARDTFVAGLISFAVSWPVAIIISNCFSLSTATDNAQLHGRTRWLNWPMKYRLLLGRLHWRFQDPAAAAAGPVACLKRFLASWWCSTIWVDGMVMLSDALQRWRGRGREQQQRREEAPASKKLDSHDCDYADGGDLLDEEEEVRFGAVTTGFKHAGFVVLYLCWGIFAWITFACARTRTRCCARCPAAVSIDDIICAVASQPHDRRLLRAYLTRVRCVPACADGRLVYNLIGVKAERDFTRSWGVGIGLSQLSDAQALITSTLQALAVVTVLEMLWLVHNANWHETFVEFASVQGTVAAHGMWRLPAILGAYKRHFNAVV